MSVHRELAVLAQMPKAAYVFRDPDVLLQVHRCRTLGASWASIGRLFGIQEEAARMRFLVAQTEANTEQPAVRRPQVNTGIVDQLLAAGVTRGQMRKFLDETKHITANKPWHLLLEENNHG